MYSSIKRKKYKCSRCGKEFEKYPHQVNRTLKNGGNLFCSVTCNRENQSIDITNKRFGKLLVIKKSGYGFIGKKRMESWECLCDCGTKKSILGVYLKKGYTKSCGCATLEKSYGQTKNIAYCTWRGMIDRCYNIKHEKYLSYGGRGIKVYNKWVESFKNFIDDMGERPSRKYTLDRINNNGNYEPSNCRWATSVQQSRNKRNNNWIEFNGKKMIISDWAVYFKINVSTLHERIKNGQSFDFIYKYYSNKNGVFDN